MPSFDLDLRMYVAAYILRSAVCLGTKIHDTMQNHA